MELFEKKFYESMTSKIALLNRITYYIVNRKGKQMRPMFVFLVAKMLSEKKSLQEEISTFSHKQNDWLAPFQNWLKDAQSLDKIASDSDLFAKKVCAKEIFGSNLLLGEKSVHASAPKILNSFGKMGGNQWDALRASHALGSSVSFSTKLEPPPRLELGTFALQKRCSTN